MLDVADEFEVVLFCIMTDKYLHTGASMTLWERHVVPNVNVWKVDTGSKIIISSINNYNKKKAQFFV